MAAAHKITMISFVVLVPLRKVYIKIGIAKNSAESRVRDANITKAETRTRSFSWFLLARTK